MNPKLNLTIPSDLKQEIIEFALDESNLNLFIPNGDGRRYCNLNLHEVELKSKVQSFASQCYESLGINYINEEERFGNFIGVNSENAFVHEHIDEVNENGDWHVRLLFMIQKPISGGVPLINQTPIEINENESWILFANTWTHASTPVQDQKERIILSLGNYVKESDAISLLETYK